MKTLQYISILAILVIMLGSCDEFLDINKSPNATSEIEPDYLFASAAADYSANRCGGDLTIPMAFMNQQWSGGGVWPFGEERYDIPTYANVNSWGTVYVTAGNNLKMAIAQAEKSTPVNNNAIAQSKILLASIFYHATMIWGDIPFSEAIDLEIDYPKFDNQRDVLNGVIALLDEAIAKIDINSEIKITDHDFYYKGDMNKWRRLAKSLKFRALMTMVDKEPTVASKIAALLTEDDMIKAATDNFAFPFYNVSGNENPRYKFIKRYNSGVNVWFYANPNVLTFMSSTNDPRIPYYYDEGPAASANKYNSVETGKAADGLISLISSYINRADAPDVMFSYSEQLLLEAEAYARGLTGSVDLTKANEKFRAGVGASLDYYGITGIKRTAFINELTDLSVSTNPVYDIHVQQWLDLFERPVEAFTQIRRSGADGSEVPKLTVPYGAITKNVIRRWRYPSEEVTSNPNTPAQAQLDEKLWFDL